MIFFHRKTQGQVLLERGIKSELKSSLDSSFLTIEAEGKRGVSRTWLANIKWDHRLMVEAKWLI